MPLFIKSGNFVRRNATTNIMAHSFWNSSHKFRYTLLALRYFVTPFHVYRLAHAKVRCKSRKDKKILHQLHRMGIVHRSSSSHSKK